MPLGCVDIMIKNMGPSNKIASKVTNDGSSNDFAPELVDLLSKLRSFQRKAFDFAISTQVEGRFLLADEMGLGKTVTSLAIMLRYQHEWPLLILCPASLRYNWPTEIERFAPTIPSSAIYVVSGMDDAAFEKRRTSLKVVVATYSLLQQRSTAAHALQQMQFQCIIADESHNLKERTSQRCQLAMPLLQKAKRLIFISGTPALARPVELWPQISCLSPAEFGSYDKFTRMYCDARRGRFGWDVKGISNADELHSKLSKIMVRRLKSQVLAELPAKQRTIFAIKVLGNSEPVKKCRDIMKNLKEARVAASDVLDSSSHFEARRLLMAAYQASGIAKAPAVADYVVDWLRGSGTQKLLVFGHHTEVLNILELALSKQLKGVGHIRIDGATPPAERTKSVKAFQTSPKIRVALLSVTAAGVGLTLTAASTVVFSELHWTPGVLAQAEDRCHRIGQVNSVNIIYCVCKDEDVSIDMTIWKMLSRKVGNLGRLMDGKVSCIQIFLLWAVS